MRLDRPRFSGNLADIKLDASQYDYEEAASLYVQHPEGVPTPDRNSMVVGPLGSGKTIMLKTLCANWSSLQSVYPVYVDLQRWISAVAGETETYPGERLSRRAQVVLSAV